MFISRIVLPVISLAEIAGHRRVAAGGALPRRLITNI
jgi:hypothetical protein